MAEFEKLNPTKLTALREVNPLLMSLNEVTGSTFWNAYTPGQIAGTESGKDGFKRSTVMTLDSRALTLGENLELPDLSGEPICAGKIDLAPLTCTFLVV